MAFSQRQSSSIGKAQIALVCQLCETEPKLKWKCIDCELMMCQRCRDKVHQKFPSGQDHTIIDIKDISQYQAESVPKADYTKLKCGVHCKKKCCLYCRSCNKLVCQTCVAETHRKHKFCEISDEYQNKVEKIRHERENMKKGLQTLTISHAKLRKVKVLEYKSYNKTKQEIIAHGELLIDAIKKHTYTLLNEVDQNWTNISKSVDEEGKRVKEAENKFREQHYIVDKVLQTNDVEKVFSGSLMESMKIKTPPINTVFDHIQKFAAGDIPNIPKLYGKLKNVSVSYNTSLNMVQQFTTNLASITNIAACPDGSLCLYDLMSKVLHKFNPVGDTLNIISQLDLCVKDMALLPSGDLLLSVKNSSSLKLVPSGTKEVKNTPYNVSPFITAGIHMTTKNKVIMGARDTGPGFPATGPRQVIVMNQSGEKEKVFQYDACNNPLFTSVAHITSNSNNNIAVVDWVSDDFTGRVIVLHLEGGIGNIYTGHPNVNSKRNPFTPCGIVTTPSDNFVVADIANHTLHILSGEGEIITFCNTKEIGIEIPYSLTYNSTGQLYIGCYNDPAKMFIIDNFVW